LDMEADYIVCLIARRLRELSGWISNLTTESC